MTSEMKRIIFALCLSLISSLQVSAAPSAQEKFNQALEQYKENEWDPAEPTKFKLNRAAFEKMVAAAREAKISVPEEAKRHVTRGITAFRLAKDENGLRDAGDEFEKAIEIAPWWDTPYLNLALIKEQSAIYAEKADPKTYKPISYNRHEARKIYLIVAIQNLDKYLIISPNGADAKTAQTKKYELEYVKDKVEKENAERFKRETWAFSIVKKLNEKYGGGRVVYGEYCFSRVSSPFVGGGGQSPRCNEQEEKGNYWHKMFPQMLGGIIRFAVSEEDPTKVGFYDSTDSQQFIGTPTGFDVNEDISWRCPNKTSEAGLCADEKIKIIFYTDNNGLWIRQKGFCENKACEIRAYKIQK